MYEREAIGEAGRNAPSIVHRRRRSQQILREHICIVLAARIIGAMNHGWWLRGESRKPRFILYTRIEDLIRGRSRIGQTAGDNHF